MLTKKTVIIVSNSNKDMKKLAHHLFNVFGSIEGLDAAIWDEKHYKDNEPTLPASQPVIFIGETKTSKLLIPSIEWKFDDSNMRIGWLGRRAVVYVEKKTLSAEAAVNFAENLKKQTDKFQECTSSVLKKYKIAVGTITNPFCSLSIGKIKTSKLASCVKNVTDRATDLGKKIDPIFYLQPEVNLAKTLGENTRTIRQQYAYVLNTFISDYLPEFLGINE